MNFRIMQNLTDFCSSFPHNCCTVKVMVFMTMPVEPSTSNIPQQFEYLQTFKAAALEGDAIGVIVSHLQQPLEHMERYTVCFGV